MNKILDGFKFAIGFFLFFGIIFGVVYAVGFHNAEEILPGTFSGNYNFIGGNVGIGTISPIAKLSVNGNITANSICDETGNNCKDISQGWSSSGDGTPSGAIMAFYLTTCPSGWKPADGTSSTPDLRGQFLRGLNTFDNGLTIRSDSNQDPVSRSLGDFQADDTAPNSLSLRVNTYNVQRDYHESITYSTSGYSSAIWSVTGSSLNSGTTPTYLSTNGGGNPIFGGNNETRPKNVAIIYCIKE